MRTSIILLLMTYSLINTTHAQQRKRKEEIESLKIAYLTKELNLTTAEAQQFWPVYNKFSDELESIRKNHKADLANVKMNIDSLSDADISKLIDNEMQFQQIELDLRKKYIAEYKKVLPIRKVALLLRAERSFRMELLKEFRNRPVNGQPPPPPSPK